MSGYLLDTHVWLWYLLGSDLLPKPLRREIDASLGICRLSPISVWEAGILAERGRIKLDRAFGAWFALASRRLPLREAPLSFEVALRSLELALPQRDPADRFLAATAIVYDLTLITVDSQLIDAPSIPTWSGI